MACLSMYNSEQHKGHCAPMSPRISFSNDFAESQQMIVNQERSPREATPVSSDFEFSVTNYSMISADELFSKGRLLPYKDKMQKPTTLRDELLVEDEDIYSRPPKGSARWKGFLGLKKSHIGSKKADRTAAEVSMEKSRYTKKLEMVHEEMPVGKTSQLQELLNNGEGSSCKDVEMGL